MVLLHVLGYELLPTTRTDAKRPMPDHHLETPSSLSKLDARPWIMARTQQEGAKRLVGGGGGIPAR
jgi:hypothetical protein